MQQIPIGIDVKVQRIAKTTATIDGAVARTHVLSYSACTYVCIYTTDNFASGVHIVAQRRNGEGAAWCHVPPATQQTM